MTPTESPAAETAVPPSVSATGQRHPTTSGTDNARQPAAVSDTLFGEPTTGGTGSPNWNAPPGVAGGRDEGAWAAGGNPAAQALLVITVHGRPITQGSKVKGRYGMWDANAKTLKPWRDNVRSAALEALGDDPDQDRGFGAAPVEVDILFAFARPTNHYRTGRNAHLLRDTAPAWPVSARIGDVDKLIRACLDSLTDAQVFHDDSQVARVRATKTWAGESLAHPGAVIRVQAIP